MANDSTIGRALGPGQRERIVRSERTDPRAIVAQAAWIAICATFIIVLAMGATLLNRFDYWYRFARYWSANWKWLILIPIAPWPIAASICIVVLLYEIFDPNYPPPRDAVATTRIIWPGSKERAFPPAGDSRPQVRGYIDFGLDGDDNDA